MHKRTFTPLRSHCALLLLLACTLLLPSLARAENRGLIWAVPGEHCTLWLAGTIHFANQELYPLPQALEQAFAKSAVLAVEADVTRMTQEDVQLLNSLATYPPGETLAQHIPAKTLLAFQEAGLDMTPFNSCKPWYAAMMGITTKLAAMGYSPDLGIDVHMLKKAHGCGLPVTELEGIQHQFRLMATLARANEQQFMQFMLHDIKNMESQARSIMGAWKRGDADALAGELFRELDENPQLQPFYEAIFFHRNKGMAEKITAFLQSGKNHLVLIGAGHLVGPGSVITLLKEKGYAPVQQ